MLTNDSEKYRQSGIHVYSGSDRVKVVYDGLLPKSGAAHVYAHVGYGNKWENESDYAMLKTSHGFEVSIQVRQNDTLNIAFKDCANNWDNNSGENYSFRVYR